MVIADVDREQSRAVMEGIKSARREAPLWRKTAVKLLVSTTVPIAPLQWQPEQLVEVLRARVKAASDGSFGSLDAISDLGVRHTEEKIISSLGNISPAVTPRDAIAFANLLLQLGAESGNNLLTEQVFHQAESEFS